MKLLTPWVCFVVAAGSAVAESNHQGIDAYREGQYFQANDLLNSAVNHDPVVDYYLGRMNLYGYGVLKNNILALRYFKQAAERGFLPAQRVMAKYMLNHDNDLPQALYWFKKAADQNDVQAQMYCAAAYLFGAGASKNEDAARRYYIAAAKNGNALAQYQLAQNFMSSKSLESKRLGLLWLTKAVEKNEPDAQRLLGQLYASGTLVPQDLDRAKALFEQALAQGNIQANTSLGDLAHQQSNDALAKTYYDTAAAAGDFTADLALGKLYLDEKSALYHPETGFQLILKSAQHQVKEAQKLLASLYKSGKGTPVNATLAQEWQARATKSESSSIPHATEAVQWLTHHKASTWIAAGYGLHGISVNWTNKMALRGNIYNQYPQMTLIEGKELYKPNFNVRDPNQISLIEYYDAMVKALGTSSKKPWDFPRYPLTQKEFTPRLEEKAVLGDSDVQFQLGQMYQQGVGVEKDIQKAIKYYAQATALQDLRAEYNLGLIWLEGETGTPDYRQAMGWLNDAAFKGNVEAQYVLGRILQSGYQNASNELVIQPDSDQALSMYHLASSAAYGPAEFELAEMLIRDPSTALSVLEKQKRIDTMKLLYKDAVIKGVKEAALPLAFFDAMSPDKSKHAYAYEVAEQEAKAGNAQAALLYAMLLDRGIGVEADHAQAMQWYEKSSDNPVSAYILGSYAVKNAELEKGRTLLQKSADAGFSYAYLNLAILDKQENKDFLPALTKAHHLGNVQASILLADYHLTDAQDDAGLKEARSIYQQLADKGDSSAELKLGYMLESGLGGGVDMARAALLYQQASEQGNAIAQYKLGMLNQLGWIANQPDYPAAKAWYARAMDHYAPAALASGYLYETVEDNYVEASKQYTLAAKLGSSIAEYNLGLIYEKGKGQPVDAQKAEKLYLLAADKGHVQAMVQLAGLYFNGIDEPDEEKAVLWYKKAADKGDREALYQMGLLSETGVELKQNYTDAARYYHDAAAKGNDKAKFALARMYQYGLGIPKNIDSAVALYTELAQKNNGYAQFQLAMLNDKGSSKEKQLLENAAKNGSNQALKTLQRMNAEAAEQLSFIEPMSFTKPLLKELSAQRLYLLVLSTWNRGDEENSRVLLSSLLKQYPDYEPAKHVYDQLIGVNPVVSSEDKDSTLAKSV